MLLDFYFYCPLTVAALKCEKKVFKLVICLLQIKILLLAKMGEWVIV